MEADFGIALKLGGAVGLTLEVLLSATSGFIERLHPEGFGDVGDGFGQAVEGGAAGQAGPAARRFDRASGRGLIELGSHLQVPHAPLARLVSSSNSRS